jgi:hypothetical protein
MGASLRSTTELFALAAVNLNGRSQNRRRKAGFSRAGKSLLKLPFSSFVRLGSRSPDAFRGIDTLTR